MKQVTIKDKTFDVFISSDRIQQRVRELGQQIDRDYKGKTPVFVPVLNGSVLFFADLLKYITIECEISFVRVSSYRGTQSGTLRNVLGLAEKLEGRSVVIVEDIVDSGNTLVYLQQLLGDQKPAEVKTAALLFKPDALKQPVTIDYTGFEVPNNFLVGYGLDYDGLGRNLNDIYTLS